MKNLLLSIILFVTLPAHALEIDPANSVLGVPWDSSEEIAEKILGKPNGFFQATKYQVNVATDESQIQFNFSSTSMNGAKEEFKFGGLEIHYEL